MPDFSKGSTFNQDANFQGVKFGADAPLLETELNELQDIQTEARADIIRDTIPSGFVQLGELDFDYMLNNENCVKLKTDSVAYVNGYKIKISKDTIIDIGRAPEIDAREDLLFLEVWKEEVTKDSQLTVAGGEGQASTSNNILDPRVGQETSRRVALKWRIRHVADVDFNYFPNGFHLSGTIWKGTEVCGQGGNSEPTYAYSKDLIRMYCTVGSGSSDDRNRNINFKDVGLYMCGDGTNSSKQILKTLDGYVYAIPMFRLYRKPTCGKAIPFEYQKMNPKVNYSKFTSLMKEEKVERVVNENIKGECLINLAQVTSRELSTSSPSGELYPKMYNLKPSTTYTISYYLKSSNFLSNVARTSFFRVECFGSDDIGITSCYGYSGNVTSDYVKVVDKFTTPSSFFYCRLNLRNAYSEWGVVSNTAFIKDVIILEGDWTNKKMPSYFEGLKGLGEDENNLIEVKNCILNESSYDPDTVNLKLNTVKGSNYLLSDNALMPQVESQVKRGSNKLLDQNSFGQIESVLVGDETIEFNKVKGRTIQNLHSKARYNLVQNGLTENIDYSLVKSDNLLRIQRLTSTEPSYLYVDCGVVNKSILKPLTKYTVVFKKCTNIKHLLFTEGSFSNPITATTPIVNNMAVVTTFENINIGSNQIVYVYLDSYNTNKTFEIGEIMILEGDWSNTPLAQIPYVKGIESSTENEGNKLQVYSLGKNLLDPNSFVTRTINGITITQNNGKLTLSGTCTDVIDIYFMDDSPYFYRKSNELKNFALANPTKKFSLSNNLRLINYLRNNAGYTINTSTQVIGAFVRIEKGKSFDNNELLIQLEISDSSTSYEPYTKYAKSLNLLQPLRSLPNGVCDTIEGNKVIRRVGVKTYNGTESWSPNNTTGTTTNRFILTSAIDNCAVTGGGHATNRYMCDTLKTSGWSQTVDIGITISAPNAFIYNNTLALTSEAIKTWLSQNPTTVYYELANPIEEFIEPNYDKESIKTYQLDAPLRSLPNGVKDEIVGNKLIRRCGQLLLNGTENWITVPSNDNDDTLLFQLNVGGSKASSNELVCCQSTVLVQTANKVWSTLNTNHCISLNIYGTIHFRCSKALLGSGVDNLQKFKSYLKDNPVPVIYQLSKTIEKSIRESNFNEMNFDKQRLFKSGSWLREIPNGAKDKIEGKKVIRRVKAITFTGTEEWVLHNEGVNDNTLAFHTSVTTDKKPNTVMVSDKFEYAHSTLIPTSDKELISGQLETSVVYIRILKSKLGTQDATGFKKWLSLNPVKVLYELQTPTEEVLTSLNNMYPPYHDLNSYCGSLYVGNGTNDLSVNSVIKAESIIASTDFRSIENKGVVTNCKYKKSYNGISNYYIGSSSKNIVDESNIVPYGNYVTGVYRNNKINLDNSSQTSVRSLAFLGTPVYLKNGEYYTFSTHNIEGTESHIFGIFVSKTINVADPISVGFGINQPQKFTLPTGFYYVRVYTDSGRLQQVSFNLLLENNSELTSYEPFVPCKKYIENMESNDIDDLRHLVSLTGFNYEQVLNENFDKLLRGDL